MEGHFVTESLKAAGICAHLHQQKQLSEAVRSIAMAVQRAGNQEP